MESGDAATWASVVVALVVGGLGFLVGLIGLVIAGLARADARRANLLAEKANGIADASNAIAVEANEIARTGVEQANETSDVRWELVWLTPGQAQMRNIGRDEATEVRGEVTVDGVVQRFDLDVIEPDDGPVLDFPEAAVALHREQRERAAAEAQRGRNDPRLSMPAWTKLSTMHGQDHSVGYVMHWRTALGNPKRDEHWNGLSSVEPE